MPMSLEKNEIVSAVPKNLNTNEVLGKLDATVKLDQVADEIAAKESLKSRVESSSAQQDAVEALKLAEKAERTSQMPQEEIPIPKPEQKQTSRIKKIGNAVVAAPKAALKNIQEDPGGAAIKTGAGLGLGAAAFYLLGGTVTSVSLVPVAGAVAGVAAGAWAANKIIKAVRKRMSTES